MQLSAKMSELSRANESARDEIAETETKTAVSENDIVHNNGRVEALREQIEGTKKSAGEFDKQIDLLSAEIEKKNSELFEINAKSDRQNALLTQISEEGQALEGGAKELDREIALFTAKRTEARVSLSNSEQAWADLKNQLEEITEQTESREGLIENYKQKKSELQKSAAAIEQEKQENENKLAGYSRLLESKRSKLDESEQSLSKLHREHDQKKSRFDVLSDVERNMTGYFASVKAIISAAKSGQMTGIHGTVADIIKVGGKFSTAIEIALGSALQNIIVESEETAKRCIRFLKESSAGRATFLPLTSIKGRELELSAFPELTGEEGYLGLGHELIAFDDKYCEVIKSLLGRTAIAEDIDVATFLAKKYGYKFRIVTLDGQVINAGGSFTGGSVKETAGIISRKQEIETLAKELEKLGEKLTFAKNDHTLLTGEVNKMAIETEGYKEKLAELLNDEIKLSAELGGVDNLIAQCEEQAENAQLIIDRNKSQMAAQEALIQRCGEILEETAISIKANEKKAEELGALQAISIEKRNRASDEITRLNLETLSVKKDIESLNQQTLNMQLNKQRLGEDSGNLEAEIENLLVKNSELNELIKHNKERIMQITASFSGNREEIEKSANSISNIEKKLSEINKEIREKTAERERFSNALVLAKERKSNAESEINRIKNELWEKYELAPSEANSIAEPIANMRAAKAELVEVRKSLAALGSVNFAAIEEFIEVGERHKNLTEQLDDVERSKSELERLILELTVSIKEKFLESFNAINYHFERIFMEIFGGGKARLELTDPDDVLGSGIEIFAAPPGKLIKSLISLSGGEQAMVAITIYFAILLHRPTPFCMLDEVDAALDEVNIIKYVTYLKRFSARTQLMLITHRRGTIEGCDVLYGVFMQEKGVSRLLKQELAEDFEQYDVEII
jgi:chromosome segregation protein